MNEEKIIVVPSHDDRLLQEWAAPQIIGNHLTLQEHCTRALIAGAPARLREESWSS